MEREQEKEIRKRLECSHLPALPTPPSSEGQTRPDRHPTSGAGPSPCPAARRSGLCQVGVSVTVPGEAPPRRTHGTGVGSSEPFSESNPNIAGSK